MRQILSLLFICNCNFVFGQIWQPLQADFNIVGFGLKSQFVTTHSVYELGIGFGINTINSFNEAYYRRPKSARNTDVAFPIPYIATYTKLGYSYYFKKIVYNPFGWYTQAQYIIFSPSYKLLSLDQKKLSLSHRLQAKLGYRHQLSKKSSWSIGYELGAGMWSNYNASYISGAPILNVNVSGNIISSRKTKI